MLPVKGTDGAADGVVDGAIILKAGFFFGGMNIKVHTGRLYR